MIDHRGDCNGQPCTCRAKVAVAGRGPVKLHPLAWFSLGWIAGIGFAWLTLTFQ